MGMKKYPYGNFMLKIYHIHPLFLILILLVTSCAVNPAVDLNSQVATEDKFKAEKQQGKILYDQKLQQLAETHPEAYVLYQQAHAVESRGEMDLAIETYHRAMQQTPEDGFLLTALGMAYLRKEDIVPARRYLLKAVSFDPDYYKSRLGLGYVYLQNQQFKPAATQLKASLQLLATLEGTYLLGEAEEGNGNFQKAQQLYQAVILADKNSKLGKAAATRLRSLSK
ncbi:MAG: hypothetical protein DRH07_09080 [Deltaproteobacteria bacterium]|nr:MAG: hypothetical protein DRH07_09080 [Deltaproteobacteria bacterium]